MVVVIFIIFYLIRRKRADGSGNCRRAASQQDILPPAFFLVGGYAPKDDHLVRNFREGTSHTLALGTHHPRKGTLRAFNVRVR